MGTQQHSAYHEIQRTAPQMSKQKLAGIRRNETIGKVLLAATGRQVFLFTKLLQLRNFKRGKISHEWPVPEQDRASPVAVADQIKNHRQHRSRGSASVPQPHKRAGDRGVGVVSAD
jgi:hypothetical protein